MAGVQYPAQIDNFAVPAAPATTSLSSSGSADRAHTQSHRDMGNAITAVETNAALKTHDHSGVDDRFHGGKLLQVNTHEQVDTDAGATSIHHTLGTLPNQAATGNHTHDYAGGTIYNKPIEVCLSTQRPAAPFLGKQIYEYDTNRARVWSAFTGNTVSHVVLGREDFEYVIPVGMSADWHLSYINTYGNFGTVGTPNGHALQWNDDQAIGTPTNRCFARRIKTADMHTASADQVIVFQTGDMLMEQTPFGYGDPVTNDYYFRVSDDENQYIRVAMSYGAIDFFVSTSSATKFTHEVTFGNRLWGQVGGTQITWTLILIGRTITVYRDGALFGTVTDTANVTAPLDANRGWAMGMQAAGALITQTTPSNVNYISIADAAQYGTIQRWTLLSSASVPHVRLRQTVAQQLSSNGSIIEWQQIQEDNFTSFNPTVNTDIVIVEPGVYSIDCAIQWDPSLVSDIAYAILCVNGLETEVRNQGAMRGNTFTPGFSQSLAFSGKLRLNATDIVTVKAKYAPAGGLFNFIFSFFDGPSKVQSRIELSFIGV